MGKERYIWILKSTLLMTALSGSNFKCAIFSYLGWKLNGHKKLKNPLDSIFSKLSTC